jgi:hypothetical protein
VRRMLAGAGFSQVAVHSLPGDRIHQYFVAGRADG